MTWHWSPGHGSGGRHRNGPAWTGQGPRPGSAGRTAGRGAGRRGREHAERPGQSLVTGRSRPLSVHSADGSLLRVPDTPANRAAFGSVGTADGSAAWPAVRLFPLSDVLIRSPLAMPWGAAGTDKAAAEQGLLDEVLAKHPDVLAKDQVWLLDRLWHGVRRIAALIERTHVLIRVKSDITLKRVSEILRDGSYLAELRRRHHDDRPGHRVLRRRRGQAAPEMFCLDADLLDWEECPAPELAGL